MTRVFVRQPVSTWMIFIAFVVLAIYALPKIEVEAIPEVDLPTISVTTTWNGASPKAIQRSITLQVEEAVRGTHGVEKVRSESRAGTSVVRPLRTSSRVLPMTTTSMPDRARGAAGL